MLLCLVPLIDQIQHYYLPCARSSRHRRTSSAYSVSTMLTHPLAMIQKIRTRSTTHVHHAWTRNLLVRVLRRNPLDIPITLTRTRAQCVSETGTGIRVRRNPRKASNNCSTLSAILCFLLRPFHKLHGTQSTSNLGKISSTTTSRSGCARMTAGSVRRSRFQFRFIASQGTQDPRTTPFLTSTIVLSYPSLRKRSPIRLTHRFSILSRMNYDGSHGTEITTSGYTVNSSLPPRSLKHIGPFRTHHQSLIATCLVLWLHSCFGPIRRS